MRGLLHISLFTIANSSKEDPKIIALQFHWNNRKGIVLYNQKKKQSGKSLVLGEAKKFFCPFIKKSPLIK